MRWASHQVIKCLLSDTLLTASPFITQQAIGMLLDAILRHSNGLGCNHAFVQLRSSTVFCI